MQSTYRRDGTPQVGLKQEDLTRTLHVAIIMDGNGRWATRRGLPRSAGHRAGVEAAQRVVEAAPDLGVATLTLFAFSSDNWRRPRAEVSALMSLLRQYLQAELHAPRRKRRPPRSHRPPRPAADGLERGDRRSRAGLGVGRAPRSADRPRLFLARRHRRMPPPAGAPSVRRRAKPSAGCSRRRHRRADVDLLIRSGGEKRLSDFPAVGIGLRRALLRRHLVARLRRRRSRCGHCRLPRSRAALRRAWPHRAAGCGGMTRSPIAVPSLAGTGLA